MTVNLSPFAGAGAQFFTDNGVPLAGGKIYTYAAGTTTPKATYTDYTGGTAHANPIILDAGGRPPSEIWLNYGDAYKFILKDIAADFSDAGNSSDPQGESSALKKNG